MTSTYCGETDGKKIARYVMFQKIRHMTRMSPMTGSIITLCGQDAAEVRVLRDGIKLSGERCLFVDTNNEALLNAKNKWPTCRVMNKPMLDVIQAQPRTSISLANMDFMGGLSNDVLTCFATLANKLRPFSFVLWTSIRGREQENKFHRDFSHWRVGTGNAKNCTCGKKHNPYNQQRSGAMIIVGKTLLSTAMRASFVGTVDYYSNRSPMRTTLYQMLPVSFAIKRNDAMPAVINLRTDFTVREFLMGEDRIWKYILPSLGPEDDAALLNMERSTITAWLAHRSRGTYANEGQTT